MSRDHRRPAAGAPHVTIVGGGISGLSAAWFLQQARQQGFPHLQYTLLEKAARWGGKINTDAVAGFGDAPFIVEGGPDSFITQKPWALQLARSLGLEDRLLPTNDAHRNVFVLNHGRPTPLPDGLQLIVPTRFAPFIRSPLISPLGKLRMGLELFLPARKNDEDESLAQFVTRRLGKEALDKIAEPLLSGIYNAEAEKQSLLATFPGLRQFEKEHGSLIKAMRALRQAAARSRQDPAVEQRPPSMFLSFQNGMEELVTELSAQLEGDCRLDTAVQAIDTACPGYELTLNDGSRLVTNAVVLAVPAYIAAQLLEPLAPDAARLLEAIRYVSTGTISLGFRADQINHPLDGFGIVIPRTEERAINAITWSSTKFDRRAPEGYVLLRAFFGGSRTPHMMSTGDDELLAVVRREIAAIMGITTPHLFHRIYRYFDANPQYDVGHLSRVATIEASLPRCIHVTGSPYGGIGIPDCVYHAQVTVDSILNGITTQAA